MAATYKSHSLDEELAVFDAGVRHDTSRDVLEGVLQDHRVVGVVLRQLDETPRGEDGGVCKDDGDVRVVELIEIGLERVKGDGYSARVPAIHR